MGACVTRRESALLVGGMVAGWLASVSAHLIAHQMAGGCIELTVPREPPPYAPNEGPHHT
jgi:hypothetical protein